MATYHIFKAESSKEARDEAYKSVQQETSLEKELWTITLRRFDKNGKQIGPAIPTDIYETVKEAEEKLNINPLTDDPNRLSIEYILLVKQ